MYTFKDFDIFKDEYNFCYQIRTKSTIFTIEFDEKEKESIFIDILDVFSKNENITYKNFVKKFNNVDKSKLIDVVQKLSELELFPLDFLIDFKENNIESDDIKPNNNPYFDKEASENIDFSNKTITIFGDDEGHLTKEVSRLIKTAGFKNRKTISYNKGNNNLNFEESDFIVVISDRWSPYHLEKINKRALENNIPWIYVGGITENIVTIGPLFYGKETGCYNCLISRMKSINDYPDILTEYEKFLKENKKASKPDIIPNSFFYNNIVANFVVIELFNFFIGFPIPNTWRTMLSIDIYNFDMVKHRLLKKPYCEVCKPDIHYNSAPWLEEITLSDSKKNNK